MRKKESELSYTGVLIGGFLLLSFGFLIFHTPESRLVIAIIVGIVTLSALMSTAIKKKEAKGYERIRKIEGEQVDQIARRALDVVSAEIKTRSEEDLDFRSDGFYVLPVVEGEWRFPEGSFVYYWFDPVVYGERDFKKVFEYCRPKETMLFSNILNLHSQILTFNRWYFRIVYRLAASDPRVEGNLMKALDLFRSKNRGVFVKSEVGVLMWGTEVNEKYLRKRASYDEGRWDLRSLIEKPDECIGIRPVALWGNYTDLSVMSVNLNGVTRDSFDWRYVDGALRGGSDGISGKLGRYSFGRKKDDESEKRLPAKFFPLGGINLKMSESSIVVPENW